MQEAPREPRSDPSGLAKRGASRRFLSGLLKLMYPHGEVSDEQLGELFEVALEGRQRVRNQLHLIAAGEIATAREREKAERQTVVVPHLACSV